MIYLLPHSPITLHLSSHYVKNWYDSDFQYYYVCKFQIMNVFCGGVQQCCKNSCREGVGLCDLNGAGWYGILHGRSSFLSFGLIWLGDWRALWRHQPPYISATSVHPSVQKTVNCLIFLDNWEITRENIWQLPWGKILWKMPFRPILGGYGRYNLFV